MGRAKTAPPTRVGGAVFWYTQAMKNKFLYITAFHFLNDGFSASLLLFLPFIAKDLGLNLVQVGALGSALNVLAMVLALPTIFLARRFGSFKIILMAMFTYGLGYLLISVSG